MIKLKKIQYIIIVTIIISIFSLSVINSSIVKKETMQTNGNTISNKKICWGIKRNKNNEQPDVGEKNKQILEANNGICYGNKEKPYIYLTFDEGYEAGYTSKILDTLKDNEVTATFFITAHYLNSAGEIVERMIEEGHTVRKSHIKSYYTS